MMQGPSPPRARAILDTMGSKPDGCHTVTDSPSPSSALTAEPSDLALRLGYAGLIPFVAGALVIWLLSGRANLAEPLSFAEQGLAGYAALVAALLGGVPWGLAMRRAGDAVAPRAWWSGVAYLLGAWLGLCMPPHAGLVVLGGVLIGCYFNDRKLYPALGAAAWLKLRFRLTAIASFSCFIAAAQI